MVTCAVTKQNVLASACFPSTATGEDTSNGEGKSSVNGRTSPSQSGALPNRVPLSQSAQSHQSMLQRANEVLHAALAARQSERHGLIMWLTGSVVCDDGGWTTQRGANRVQMSAPTYGEQAA